jgi:Fe2+ or Zn2+ uptake regulation protein
MSDFANLLREDRRLTLLRLLADGDDYSANHYLLHAALPGFGHAVGEDTVRTDLAWLSEQGLVTTNEVGGVLVAKLTGRGDDVAQGRARVPGVKRPRPE